MSSTQPDTARKRTPHERRTEQGGHRARRPGQDRDEAITEAGRLLVASGAVDEAYVDAMHERETSVSTFMGNGLAIPHGTNEAKALIRHTAISFVRYDEPIDWKGSPAGSSWASRVRATTT